MMNQMMALAELHNLDLKFADAGRGAPRCHYLLSRPEGRQLASFWCTPGRGWRIRPFNGEAQPLTPALASALLPRWLETQP
ncbi:hypothetical protein [Ferrimonas balearica]|uniref:hypothetical protein n=1 Tax=Ferrimonas balearica TaxID=44012 RepID=UPI001C993E2E|nr:hypothetical protein [Ferrimonas balearica]MBY5992346.1 hypothetical protein [Ferrimonas balearica]